MAKIFPGKTRNKDKKELVEIVECIHNFVTGRATLVMSIYTDQESKDSGQTPRKESRTISDQTEIAKWKDDPSKMEDYLESKIDELNIFDTADKINPPPPVK